MALELKDYAELIGAFMISAGGTTVIVVGLAKWFGDFLSKRLLDDYKGKHEKELQELKNKFQAELEVTKAELEKTRAKYARYSEKQFESYNNLWIILQYTKRQADGLWQNPAIEKMAPFAEQLRQTRNALSESMLFIEQEHYEELVKLLDNFEKFRVGKIVLSQIVNGSEEEVLADVSLEELEAAVANNKALKRSYDRLILKIASSLRDHIKS